MLAGLGAESSVIPWVEPPAPLGIDLPAALAVGGVLAAMAWARRRTRLAGLAPRRAIDGLALMVALGMLLGHVLDVALYRTAELRADWTIVLPWHGGYCSLGAALGFLLAVALAFRAPGGGLRWDYLDLLAPAILLGLALLRVGCFLGHHHAGSLSSFLLAVGYPGGARHDLGLYEALLLAALFAVAFLWERRARPAPGVLALGSVAAYSTGRFLLEFLRGDDLEALGRHSDPRYAGLTLVQFATSAAVLVCFRWLWMRRRGDARNAKGPAVGAP